MGTSQDQHKEIVRFAVVGCGRIGSRHAAVIQQHQEAALTAICDTLPPSKLSEVPDGIPFFQSIEALLQADILVDVVNICTPNGLHATHAIHALEARKHIVIEKPMALTKLECENVIHKALNVSRQVFCVMQNRYSPPAVWLKHLLDNAILGKIYLVEINCYWNRDHRYYFPEGKKHTWKGSKLLDGGVLFTQFAHFIDILFWLFGDITAISSRFSKFNASLDTELEDNGVVQFELVHGGLGTLTYSTACWQRNFESSLTVIAEKGTVKIGGQYMEKVEYCHIENYEMPVLNPTNPSNEYNGYTGSASNHQFVIQNVIDVLKYREVPTTNAMEGMKVVDIIERIYKSSQFSIINRQ